MAQLDKKMITSTKTTKSAKEIQREKEEVCFQTEKQTHFPLIVISLTHFPFRLFLSLSLTASDKPQHPFLFIIIISYQCGYCCRC